MDSVLSHSDRVAIAEAVEEDPTLTPPEKETTITFDSVEGRAWVFSAMGSIMKRLVKLPHFDITGIVSPGEREGVSTSLSFDQWATDEPPVTGVRGYVPIGSLKVSASPRSKDYPVFVVSDYSEGGE